MRTLLLSIAAALACLLMAGCRGDDHGRVVFSAFRSIEPAGWRFTDTLRIPLHEMTDTAAVRGDVAVTVRHSVEYPYSNLWLEVILPADTVAASIELADVFGSWHGHGMGLTYELTDTILRDVTLSPADTLLLHHLMRVDTVSGLEQLGIFFIAR
ncbi:MAG: gliding motility lipoprotein GldH [Muribaculaceae bacterium]|nr:gliding motility lipoprotein GldH [Muribaculaceae bacterium]